MFFDNTAKYGSAIYNAGYLTDARSLFYRNQAQCGTLYNSRATGHTVMVESIFMKNTADQEGGAIYSQSTLDMNNCDITDNEAELSGGGIFNDATGTLNLNGGRIERNEVPTYTYTGGGVYNRGVLNINGCNIAGDTPDDIHDEGPIHE